MHDVTKCLIGLQEYRRTELAFRNSMILRTHLPSAALKQKINRVDWKGPYVTGSTFYMERNICFYFNTAG